MGHKKQRGTRPGGDARQVDLHVVVDGMTIKQVFCILGRHSV